METLPLKILCLKETSRKLNYAQTKEVIILRLLKCIWHFQMNLLYLNKQQLLQVLILILTLQGAASEPGNKFAMLRSL